MIDIVFRAANQGILRQLALLLACTVAFKAGGEGLSKAEESVMAARRLIAQRRIVGATPFAEDAIRQASRLEIKAGALVALAQIAAHHGDYRKATASYREAIALYQQGLGPTHKKTIACIVEVTDYLDDQNEPEAAMELIAPLAQQLQGEGLSVTAQSAKNAFRYLQICTREGKLNEEHRLLTMRARPKILVA